jgi:hypothetical protein
MRSGSIIATIPTASAARTVVAVHPYQSMFGPSPGRGPSYPHTRRFVAGWKVTSGQLKNWITQYASGPKVENVIAKVLNLADAATDEVDGVALVVVVVVAAVDVAVGVFMIRTLGHC